MIARLHLCPLELAAVEALPVDAFALFVAEDERPLWGLGGLLDWRSCAGLSKHLLSGALAGSAGETLLTTAAPGVETSRIFAFGLGPQGGIDHKLFARRAREACEALRKAGIRRVAIGVPEKPAMPEGARLLADALAATGELDAWIVGPLPAMSRAIPEATAA